MPDREQALAALRNVVDPCSRATGRPMSVIDLGLVDAEGVSVSGDKVEIGLVLTDPMCVFYRDLSSWIEQELLASGFSSVSIKTLDELWVPSRMKKRELQ